MGVEYVINDLCNPSDLEGPVIPNNKFKFINSIYDRNNQLLHYNELIGHVSSVKFELLRFEDHITKTIYFSRNVSIEFAIDVVEKFLSFKVDDDYLRFLMANLDRQEKQDLLDFVDENTIRGDLLSSLIYLEGYKIIDNCLIFILGS
jgi:hypothetical protein